MEKAVSATDRHDDSGAGPTPRALRLAIGVAAALLLLACGLLWARFGAQVFLDAATDLWKTCF